MAKRIAILSCLLLVALLAGLLGARMLGGPFISPNPQEGRAPTERFALGRDIYHQEDYAVETRYDPYRPGAGRIASPSVAGARAIEPYEAARPEHRVAFDSEDGNFMDATGLPEDDYAMIDPPARVRQKAPSPGTDADGPANLLPKGYVRRERPAYPQAEPAVGASVPAIDSSDPVADTERRIMDIASGRPAPQAADNGPNDVQSPAPQGPAAR